MLTLRKLMLMFLVTGLALNPVYASALMVLNDIVSPQAIHVAVPPSPAVETAHCHSQSSQHHQQEPSCCKTGQCDCAHACAVLPSIVPTAVSYSGVNIATRFSSGLPPLAPVRFFRPPIV